MGLWCSACKVGLAERDGLCPGCEGWTMPDGRLPAAGSGSRVPVAVATAPANRASQGEMVAARALDDWVKGPGMRVTVRRGGITFLPAGGG